MFFLICFRPPPGDLKAKIMDITGIPVCRQALKGWQPNEQPCTNATVLHTLNIALENELILSDLSAEGFLSTSLSASTPPSSSSTTSSATFAAAATDDDMVRRHTDTYALNIMREPEGIELSLNFPGTQRLIDIKTDVYTITDIPVRHQDWTGWPATMTNDTTLAASGINSVHKLHLRSTAPTNTTTTTASSVFGNNLDIDARAGTASTRSSNSNIIEIDSDEYESATDADFNADEEMFTEPIAPTRVVHLSEYITLC